eukprot:scaffold65784_cov60-Phaeocystis_antarctica.AAC.4
MTPRRGHPASRYSRRRCSRATHAHRGAAAGPQRLARRPARAAPDSGSAGGCHWAHARRRPPHVPPPHGGAAARRAVRGAAAAAPRRRARRAAAATVPCWTWSSLRWGPRSGAWRAA